MAVKPVAATKIMLPFKPPPREAFDEPVPLSSGHLRMRIGPDIEIGVGVCVKPAGDEWLATTSNNPDQACAKPAVAVSAPGACELFGRDDVVDAQWRIGKLIPDNATLVYPYYPKTWSPDEAQALIEADGPWCNPNTAAETIT